MKRAMWLSAVICLGFLFLPSHVSKADTVKKGAFRYTANALDAKTCRIVRIEITNSAKCKTMKIPSRIGGRKVKCIGAVSADEVKNVFGAYANENGSGWGTQGDGKKANKIQKIVLPDTVEELAKGALSGLQGVRTVKLSRNLRVIGSISMSDMPKLRKLHIPASVEKGVETLQGSRWKSFTISKKNRYYKVKRGSLLSKDGKIFFGSVSRAKELRIPNGVTELSNFAFSLAKNEFVYIPASVRKMGVEALSNKCGRKLSLSRRNKTFAMSGGCLYKKKNHELVAAVSKKGTLTLSSGIRILDCPVSIMGKKVDKVIFPNNKLTLRSSETAEHYRGWMGERVSKYAKWYMKGNQPPIVASGVYDMGYGAVYVPKKYYKKYKAWLEKTGSIHSNQLVKY